jgi:hypothetical protein
MTQQREPAAVRRDREQVAELQRQVAEVGFFVRGTLSKVWGRCGKTTCRCQATPPKLHGPYVQWTRKVAAKTVTVRVRPEDVPLYEEWVANSRRLDKLVDRMRDLSLRATTRIIQARRSGGS